MAANDNTITILNELLEQYRNELSIQDSASDFFEYFSAEQALKEFDLSYDEIDSGLVGDGGDGGIDALYLLVNGQLIKEEWNFSELKRNIAVELVGFRRKHTMGFKKPQ